MRFRVVWVGKTHDPWIREGIDEYAGRIARYHPLQIVELKEGEGDPERTRTVEEKRILPSLPPGSRVILLDEGGELLSSVAFATLIDREKGKGTGELAFVVGGAYGVTGAVRSRAFMTLSLSRMTFTHRMVRPFLLEQIYRACTILNNEKYHH